VKLDKREIAKNKVKINSMIQHLMRGLTTKNMINILLADDDIKNCIYLKDMLTSYRAIVVNQIKNLDKQAQQLFFVDLDDLLLDEEEEEWI